jgi:predicted secreted hydrolase
MIALGLVAGCSRREETRAPARSGIAALRASSDDSDGFARATEPIDFQFPADHGSHPQFRNEWWYFTGNLADSNGALFGFELTFFRIAMGAEIPRGSSAWRSDQIWMAHFALTDAGGQRFFAAERFARETLGVAGAEIAPFRVHLKDWSVSGELAGESPMVVLNARDGERALALELRPLKGIVLNGDRGLDRKGPEPGNASFYYSLPRLAAQGAMTVGGRTVEVAGTAWLDREWSTSALSAGVVGWDWFSLHLSDGRDVMFYRLRDVEGRSTRFSKGSLISPDGAVEPLDVNDVELEALRTWRSPTTGVAYPVSWRFVVKRASVDLVLEPYIDNQELDLGVRYWEGAVKSSRGTGVSATGYLELAGYGDSLVPSR